MNLRKTSPLGRAGRKPAEEDDIDITPMIDCVFLLLIFFLVSSVPDQQSTIDLPAALYGSAVSQLESTVLLVAQRGEGVDVYEGDREEPAALLPADPAQRSERIREAVARGFAENKTNVVIKADRGVAYRHVARVISDVSAAPGVRLHLAVLDTE